MIIATHLRTESGDDYLFLFKNITNPAEYVHAIENQMRSELEHVWQRDVAILDGSMGAEVKYGYALQQRINEMRGY